MTKRARFVDRSSLVSETDLNGAFNAYHERYILPLVAEVQRVQRLVEGASAPEPPAPTPDDPPTL